MSKIQQQLTFNMFYIKWVNRLELTEEWRSTLREFDFNQKGGPKKFEKLIKSLPVVLPLDYQFGIFKTYVQFNTELYSVIAATDPHGCISGDVHLQQEGVVIERYVRDVSEKQYIIAGKSFEFPVALLQKYEWSIEYVPIGVQVASHPELVVDVYNQQHKLLYGDVERYSMIGNHVVWNKGRVKCPFSTIFFIAGEKKAEMLWEKNGATLVCSGEVKHATVIITRGKKKQGFFERMFGKKKDNSE